MKYHESGADLQRHGQNLRVMFEHQGILVPRASLAACPAGALHNAGTLSWPTATRDREVAQAAGRGMADEGNDR